MDENNSLEQNDYYKKKIKHGNCSKCNIVLTQDNYKKGRTVCRLCYNNNVLRYYKNKFYSNSTPKSDVSTQTDILDVFHSSNKQFRSRKQTKCKKEPSLNNQDISIINIIDSDPNHLCDKLREILSKSDMSENEYTMSKMILDELLRTKSITRKDYNSICKNIGLI